MKNLSSLVLLLCALQSFSQITITYNEAPQIGDAWVRATDTTNLSSVNPGNSGASQSWNFLSISPDRIDTLKFLAPASTPYESDFPSANIVFKNGDGAFIYSILDTNEFSIIGYGTSQFDPITIDPPGTFLKFPTNYLDVRMDSSAYTIQFYYGQFGIDSLLIVQSSVSNDTIDGWGTVKIPTGTYNALRQKSVEVILEETFGKGVATGGVWISYGADTNTTTSYSWLSNELNISIVDLELDTAGNTMSVEYTLSIDTGMVSPYFVYTVNDSLVNFTDSSLNNPASWNWDFGDGDTSTAQSPSHIYTTSGTYNVCLRATNANGGDTYCEDITIKITDPVVSKFTYFGDSLAATFTDKSTNDPNSWLWDFGDGDTSLNQNPIHTFPAFGTYYVCLIAQNNKGGNTYCDSVTVVPGSPLIIERDDAPKIGDVWVQMHDTTISGPVSIGNPGVGQTWDLSGLTKGYIDSTLYLAPQSTPFYSLFPGTNMVIIEPNQPYYYAKVDTNQFAIQGFAYGTGPFEYFHYDPDEVVYNFPTTYLSNFSDVSQYDFQFYYGQFGIDSVRIEVVTTAVDSIDGWGTVITPAGTYDALRNKSLVITATNTLGKGSATSDTWWSFGIDSITFTKYEWLSKDLSIILAEVVYDTLGNVASTKYTTRSVSGRPSGYFTYTTNELDASFRDSTFNNPTFWYWDFGDGDTALSQNPSHFYSSAGTYNVCLYASNDSGWTYYCDSVTIVFTPPSSNFSYSVDSLTLTFTDVSINNIATWYWDFGDGDTSNQQHPVHIYTATGTYYVCLTVTKFGFSDMYCDSITVDPTVPAPAAQFTFTTDGLEATFTDASTNDPATWLWNFGDGTSVTLKSPVHTYSAEGTYYVCLTATNAGGSDMVCDSVKVSVLIIIKPVANFTYTNDSLLVVTFKDTSTNNPDTWSWDFGNGAISTVQNPVYTYPLGSTYNVCLTASNASGSDTYCDSVTVSSTGIRILHELGEVKIYPVPTSGLINIELHNMASNEVNISVINLLGENVYKYTTSSIKNQVLTIDLSGQTAGLYFINFQSEQVKVSRKIILR